MFSEITLQNLHQQLAYREERAGLSVEITHGEKRTMVSIDRGKTYFLPDSARYVEFDQMLAHYPVPVTVNGNFLTQKPYHNEAGISRSGYDGDIFDTRFNSRKPIAGPYQGAILLDGVLYAIGPCPDLKADHRYNSVTTYLVPDRQDEQPHYARSSEYYIKPNYRLDIGNGTAGWVFEGRHGRRIQCQPPLEVCVSLQQQRQKQEQDALAVIRQHSGVSDLGAPQQTHNEYRLPQHEYQSCAEYPAGLIPYGEPVTIARDFSLPQAAAYSITRALYQNPAPNLVPVFSQKENKKVVGDVSCGRLTIVADDGQTYEVTQAQDGSDLTAGLRDHNIRRNNVKAITAHLAVTYPDNRRRTVELPLDMLCDGEVYTEDVWLTDAWQDWQIDELQEILFQAYWSADNPDACPNAEEYTGEMKVLATQLLAGNRPALQIQVEQLCNGFYPGINSEHIPMMTAANGQNIIIWQPAVQQDAENPPPAWLTAAVAASRPDLDSLAVFSEASAIWGDEARRKQLLDTLHS